MRNALHSHVTCNISTLHVMTPVSVSVQKALTTNRINVGTRTLEASGGAVLIGKNGSKHSRSADLGFEIPGEVV